MDKDRIQDLANQGMEMAHEQADRMQQSGHNVGDTERWASLAGGTLAAIWGMRRGGLLGLAMGAIGGVLIYRGASGHCAMYEQLGRSSASPSDKGLIGDSEIRVTTGITIDRSPDELYSYWRNFEHLPQFMRHIVDVTQFDERRSHWVAEAPFGKTLEWDAEVIEDRTNEKIAWRSMEGSQLQNEGEIRFRPLAEGRGTEVEVDMCYRPPGGKLGTTMARYFNGITKQEIQEDIRRFKQLMEAGEMPTAEPTPAAPPTSGTLRH
ncbi:hypothetical protein CAI21_00300 [Alkalilimnicola ehrlichii]|uniref:Uncharacterized protein n=1 Tax=Alkalilimnicola ehrlichii TaxID=351052 RepID=A0A3E0X4G7_9GAMM|nr:SRPBCC family protein [Alkalilimnicola ehrlichii]RFA31140.1 hypothetical protein CAI21_00300 [Alkalilimnicola ehrlichii]RFA39575.1 hypothetical protein CAL65_02105 [Alkalilimnicola ehrlichii]